MWIVLLFLGLGYLYTIFLTSKDVNSLSQQSPYPVEVITSFKNRTRADGSESSRAQDKGSARAIYQVRDSDKPRSNKKLGNSHCNPTITDPSYRQLKVERTPCVSNAREKILELFAPYMLSVPKRCLYFDPATHMNLGDMLLVSGSLTMLEHFKKKCIFCNGPQGTPYWGPRLNECTSTKKKKLVFNEKLNIKQAMPFIYYHPGGKKVTFSLPNASYTSIQYNPAHVQAIGEICTTMYMHLDWKRYNWP